MALFVARDAPAARPSPAPVPAGIVIDASHPLRTVVSGRLFGIGVDLPAATYVRQNDTRCLPVSDAASSITLLRIGATTADDYDWRSDRYVNPLRPRDRSKAASFGYGCQSGPAASVLRLLDRAYRLKLTPIVTLNGEIDDAQNAADLVRVIVRHFDHLSGDGLVFARRVYWAVGSAPERWQYFGVPLVSRRAGEHVYCSPDQYAALVTTYAAAIASALDTARDNVAPRVVADDWISNATDQSWTAAVSAVDTQYFPFNSPDAPPSPGDIATSVTTPGVLRSAGLDQWIQGLRSNLSQYSSGRRVPVFVGQWNIDAYAPYPALSYHSAAQAVFVARMLLHLARQSVGMAAWAAPLYATSQAPFIAGGAPSPGFRIFAALRALAGARLLRVTGASSAYGRDLDAFAARQRGSVTVVVTNASARHTAVLAVRVDGLARQSTMVTIRHFTARRPDGALSIRLVSPSSARFAIPPLGVVLVTYPGR